MIYCFKRYHQRHDICVGMLSKSLKDSQFDTYIRHSKNTINLILIYNTFNKNRASQVSNSSKFLFLLVEINFDNLGHA